MKQIRSSDNYTVKITDFEGPLDLLLHLIRESKLDIKTIRLCEVTAQYMGFLAELDRLDLDLASEFIEVAATLLEIKARGILPKPKEEEPEEDIELRLKAQLEEYKILKEASEKLRIMENVDRFYKESAPMKPEYKYVLDNLNMDLLTAAFVKIMHRMQKNAAPIVERQIRMDRFTVKDKITDIRTRVKNLDISKGESVAFFELFEADFTKSEMINTFLALLELLKTQEIRAVQKEAFADIQIVRGNGEEVANIDGIEYSVVNAAD